ncbi:MAG: YkgJ family cysteine cluster protein [Desulfobacter sp.]|nr:MAG: YkgJ family cysteine cluster protein [Desulfobacter sp.]
MNALRIFEISSQGNLLEEDFWRSTQQACPFLNDQGCCIIYGFRPFSCRAYHSTDRKICQRGYEEKKEVQVPCFPLYRATTDMYSSVFIKVLGDKGFASFQVSLVKGLDILFKDEGASARWLGKKNVFLDAKI